MTQLGDIAHQTRDDAALSWVKVTLVFDAEAEFVDEENAGDIG